MDRLDYRTLLELAAFGGQPTISLSMPMQQTQPGSEHDLLQLRNAIDQASRSLLAQGYDQVVADSVLEPAQLLLRDKSFWEQPGRSLAIFAAPGYFQALRLPLELPLSVEIDACFHLRPLLKLYESSGSYFLLALSEKRARLFEGGREGLEALDFDSAPASLAVSQAAVHHQTYQGSYSANSGRGTGGRGQIFYGQGSLADREELDQEQYAHKIAAALDQHLASQHAPLLIAGTEELAFMVRQQCHYKQLLDGIVHGNHDQLSARQLHELSWPLAQAALLKPRQALLDKLAAELGTGAAGNEVLEVSRAAREGRVDTLFVHPSARAWGRIDPESGSFKLAEANAAGCHELLDGAVAATLAHGGTTYLLNEDELPGSTVAGLYRF